MKVTDFKPGQFYADKDQIAGLLITEVEVNDKGKPTIIEALDYCINTSMNDKIGNKYIDDSVYQFIHYINGLGFTYKGNYLTPSQLNKGQVFSNGNITVEITAILPVDPYIRRVQIEINGKAESTNTREEIACFLIERNLILTSRKIRIEFDLI